MPKTPTQLDREIAAALAVGPTKRETTSVRKLVVAGPRTWGMRHAPGARSSATYGVFIGDRQVATISGETRGYRGVSTWKVETLGDWLGPPDQRPKWLYSANSFKVARDWAIANAASIWP